MPTYVDNTILKAVAECDSEAALRHALGLTIQEDAHALEAGSAVHLVLADYLSGALSPQRCLAKFELLYRGYSEDAGLDNDPKGPFYRLSWTNIDAILREWFVKRPLGGFPFQVTPKLVEVGFAVPLIDDIVFVGRLDAIVQANHDRALYVLDHKTTGRLTPYWTDKFRNDSQMSGYTWAAQQTIGQPVVGVYINAIELSKLPSDPSRKCKDHGVTYSECGSLHMKTELLIYTRTPDQLDEWRATAIELARRYRAIQEEVRTIADVTKTRMRGTFTNACSFCAFSKFCAAGRPVHYADGMLIHKPWTPFELEEKKP